MDTHKKLFAVGTIMREKRRFKGLTQVAMAKELGLPANTLSRMELGQNFTAHSLLIVAKYFEISLNVLIGLGMK